MLQTDSGRMLAGLFRLWLCAILLLAFTAAVQRQRELSGVERELLRQYAMYGETGRHARDDWYPRYRHSYAVYLIENGRRNPDLLRLLLLAEACVVKHDSYLNAYSFNSDLRRLLMQEVLPRWREDPAVHWAAGICHMNACRFSEARQELMRALELGLDCDRLGIERRDILLRIMLSAAMEGDPTATLHWVRERLQENDNEAWLAYADLLARLGHYDDCTEVSRERMSDSQPDVRLAEVLLRALWWGGRHTEYIETFDYLDDILIAKQPASLDGNYIGNRPWLRRRLLGDGLASVVQSIEPQEPWPAALASVLAEDSGLLGNEAGLEMLDQRSAQLRQKLEEEGLPWRQRNQIENELAMLLSQKARAALMRSDWEAAGENLQELDGIFTWPRPLALDSSAFLLAVANGGTVEELLPLLRACIRVVPFILHSPQYAATCAHSGRDPDALQREIVHGLAGPPADPSRYHSGAAEYSDWYNGSLDW